MATGDIGIQNLLHSLEQGRYAPIVRGAMFAALIIALVLLYLFVQFRGFNTVTAMDQAQIARNIASGKGFSSLNIRPLAIWQLENAGREISQDSFPDCYQSPLNPLVNALPLRLIKAHWETKPLELVYIGDRLIAGIAILFFLVSTYIWFLVGRRIFDARLAAIGCGMVLVTDLLWQFSLSGLPQMLMLLLFSLAMLVTHRAMDARDENRMLPMMFLLGGAGALFGLMALSHGLAAWIFIGWLFFTALYFPPRGVAALIGLAAFLLVISPWLVRNFSVCGNPFGIALDVGLYGGDNPEQGLLRSLDPKFSELSIPFKSRLRIQSLEQFSNLVALLGMNIAACAFFISLMHRFRNPQTSALRWAVLLMWVMALFGMSLFSSGSEVVSSNQLHVLFIPLFTFYGLAFLMVLWNRLEIGHEILRKAFVSALVFLCALPMLMTLFAGKGAPAQWPPYLPPYIGQLQKLFKDNEIIASDMPWAVAWYAQRKALLLTETMKDFNEIKDYQKLGADVNGVFLTPVTGNLPLFSDIYRGPYREWAPLIVRPPLTKGFSLTTILPIPIGDSEYILYTDRNRWTKQESLPE